MRRFSSAGDVVAKERLTRPCFVFRPHEVTVAAQAFLNGFPGIAHYAVKANPNAQVLQQIWDSGIHAFEVASIEECRSIREQFPAATVRFMHPIKYASDIAEAYQLFGIRDFAVDHPDEVAKILIATGQATDLNLIVRIVPRSSGAVMPLNQKFGIDGDDARQLLKLCRRVAAKVGITFHVGSQCLTPTSYANSIHHAAELSRGLKIDILDVGGGFPVSYPGMKALPLQQYFEEIRCAVMESMSLAEAELWCEPGRAMVAQSQSLIVPVMARRGETLYIGEGTYGALFDAGYPKFPFPVRLLRPSSEANVAYRFFGPTCDSLDVMEGPFLLPADIQESDFLEVGQLGAYGQALITGFNGFRHHDMCVVSDDAFSDFETRPVIPTQTFSHADRRNKGAAL